MHAADLSGLSLDASIPLFELRNYDPANSNAVFRFTNEYNVSFGGNVYQSIGARITPFPLRSEGEVPQAELSVNDVLGTFSTLYYQFPRIIGAQLTYFVTLARFLDGGSSPNSAKFRSLSRLKVSHPKTFQPRREIVFVLEPRIYSLARPHGRYLGSYCEAKFADGVTCPYVGGGGGINVGNLTSCSGKFTGANGCSAHFTAGVYLPILGAPMAERLLN